MNKFHAQDLNVTYNESIALFWSLMNNVRDSLFATQGSEVKVLTHDQFKIEWIELNFELVQQEAKLHGFNIQIENVSRRPFDKVGKKILVVSRDS